MAESGSLTSGAAMQTQRASDSIAFLFHDRVQVGDVLLTRGRELSSGLIAAVTTGEYSHCAIWLANTAVKNGTPILTESDELGTGHTPLTLHTLRHETRQRLVATVPGNPSLYKLLRHPRAHELTEEQLRSATQSIERTLLLRRYPPTASLLSAAKLSPAATIVLLSALVTIDRLRGQRSDHAGTFCSEFVARCFDELNLPLFAESFDRTSIAPNDLESPTCALKEVPGMFITAAEIDDPKFQREGIQSPFGRRDVLLPSLVEEHAGLARSSNALATLQRSLHETAVAMMPARLEVAPGLHSALRRSLAIAVALGNTPGRQKLEQLMAKVLGLEELDRATAALLQTDAPDSVAVRQLVTELSSEWTRTVFEIRRSLLRHDVVTLLHLYRARRAGERSWWGRLRFDLAHRSRLAKILAEVQVQRAADRGLRALVDGAPVLDSCPQAT